MRVVWQRAGEVSCYLRDSCEHELCVGDVLSRERRGARFFEGDNDKKQRGRNTYSSDNGIWEGSGLDTACCLGSTRSFHLPPYRTKNVEWKKQGKLMPRGSDQFPYGSQP